MGRGEAGGSEEKAHAGGGGRRIRRRGWRREDEDPEGILRRQVVGVVVIARFGTKIEDRTRGGVREAGGGGKCTIEIEVFRYHRSSN